MLDERDDMFTDRETERQDFVDNEIHSFIVSMAPWGTDDLQWNIENIGLIRDALKEVLVDKLHLMTEQQFYPYREIEAVPTGDEPEQGVELIVTDDQLVRAMQKEVEDIDAEELAQWAGDALGGLCWYLNDGTYSFIPDENYYGALDFTKEEKHD